MPIFKIFFIDTTNKKAIKKNKIKKIIVIKK